jgi:uncharacterized membrane protein YidH (DUF202 family)
MQATPVRRREGPFVIPARTLLLAFGLLAVVLAAFNLFHELHAKQADTLYAAIAIAVGVVWLACIILGFRGSLIGVFGAGFIAFVELGAIGQNHFSSSAGAIGSFVRIEGLPVATTLMGLVLACVLTIMAAIVAWGHGTAYSRRRETLPLLVVAAIGAVLAILEATDNVHLAGSALPGFGKTTAEDGTFVAALTASLWLIGALWIARRRRTGALLTTLATFGVCYSFLTLHLPKSGTSLSLIATKSGLIWAVIAVAVTVLAAASLLAALVFFALALRPPRRSASAPPAPTAQRANR